MNRFRCIVLGAILLSAVRLFGQDEKDLRPVTRTYAITNATVVHAPGRKTEGANVVIKDGLIVAAGKGVAVPAEAVVIKGDSMFVYAGFIDGLNRAGVVKPKEENRDRIKDPGNPPPDRAGINPQLDVRQFLSPADKALEELRGVGFTAAQVVPHGNFLAGQSALILMGGSSGDHMVVSNRTSLYAEFSPANNIYPSTVMGIMAKWRELYKQATLTKAYESLYASNRAGLERPANDKLLEAFYPVIDQRQPVLFRTEHIHDVGHAINLKSELGLGSVVFADIKDSWPVINKIKSSGAKVYLSLELPEELKKDKDKKEAKTPGELEKDALDKRRAETIAAYAAQAAAFQKAGVVFGFAGISAKAKDIPANLRRMIAAGLSEDAALAALTTNPAQMMGVSDRMGTIDNGKMANLVVTDKSYFNEKAKVRYVFVDGVMHKMEVKEPKKSDNGAKAEIEGGWATIIQSPDGKNEFKMVFKKEVSGYSGTVSGGMLTIPAEMKDIVLEGTSLTFNFAINVDSGSMKVECDVTLEGDTFKGTASVPKFGSFPMEGTKDPKN